jgi:hypothetical protein
MKSLEKRKMSYIYGELNSDSCFIQVIKKSFTDLSIILILPLKIDVQ